MPYKETVGNLLPVITTILILEFSTSAAMVNYLLGYVTTAWMDEHADAFGH